MLHAVVTPPQRVVLGGLQIELQRVGSGPALLFLHPEIGLAGAGAALESLAQRFAVVAPAHPGFGHSDLADWMTGIDDLAFHYLAVMEALDLDAVTLVGVAFGGWIAAELATMQPHRLARLVLVNPAGIKRGGREQRDMVDIFSLTQDELDARCFHDPAQAQHFDPRSSSEDEIYVELRNRETTARFAWSPYMHNPRLIHRLPLIRVPTLVLWGESDRIAPPDYGRSFSERIPGARLRMIARAGRYPHVEQPRAFAAAIAEFAGRAAAP